MVNITSIEVKAVTERLKNRKAAGGPGPNSDIQSSEGRKITQRWYIMSLW